jgi:microcompartment protein CcmL/EutN
MSYVDPLGQEAITIVVGGSVLAVGCLMSTGCSGAVGSALSTGAKAVGNAASNVVEAIKDFCTLGDPCDEIRKQIRDLKAQIAKRELQLASDQWDLFNKAYAVNPGGALAGKGTYLGHIGYIESLRVGLVGKIAQAKAMGCL